MKNVLFAFLGLCLFAACNKEDDDSSSSSDAMLRIQFRFDENQERLDNVGNPSEVPQGHGTQTPDFNALSTFFIELVPTKFTNIRDGFVAYEAETQPAEPGGDFDEAVVFDRAIVSDEGEVFLNIPIKDIQPGTYEYLRTSVTYQNANVLFNLKNIPAPLPSELNGQQGTIAGFIGFNTFINKHTVFNREMEVNGDRQQGFWAFEPQLDEPYQQFYIDYVNSTGIESGQAPQGATTVVNPLAEFGIELPFGSCIVTGTFDQPLTISGEETEDVTLTLSFSVNKSFEWVDDNGNGEWDFNVGNATVEQVVDMGLRGLKAEVD